MSDQMDARVFLLLMAARMVGDYLYAWGGEESGEGGFDCSGFASVALMQTARAWPALYDGERTTAAGLYQYFDNKGCRDITRVSDLKPGTLIFYRRPGGGSIMSPSMRPQCHPSGSWRVAGRSDPPESDRSPSSLGGADTPRPHRVPHCSPLLVFDLLLVPFQLN